MKKDVAILVLGDQLSWPHPAFAGVEPEQAVVVLAEVQEEATYVRHNRHKIVLLFSAMRHFAAQLRERGYHVEYVPIDQSVPSLLAACQHVQTNTPFAELRVCEPGECRLREQMENWSTTLSVPVNSSTTRARLAAGLPIGPPGASSTHGVLHRDMRKRYRLLMDGDQPEGGKWNYDAETARVGEQCDIPARPNPGIDEVTQQVIDTVTALFPDNPEPVYLSLGGDKRGGRGRVEWFCEHALPAFGTYQDALLKRPGYSGDFHVSNCGLLAPLAVCEKVEAAYQRGLLAGCGRGLHQASARVARV